MKIISKTLKTLRQAEGVQNRLYSKYSHVRLRRAPLTQEEGEYVWEVADEKANPDRQVRRS